MEKIFLTLSILILFSCHKESKTRNTQEVKYDIVNTLNDSLTLKEIEKAKYNCSTSNYTVNNHPEIIFNNRDYYKKQNDSIFLRWSKGEYKNQVKSIQFSGFDTIPEKFSIFKNVNQIFIYNRNGIYGMSMFKKLKIVDFIGSEINFSSDEKWLNNIEIISAEKTIIRGLKSFKKTPNLKEIFFSFSGFEKFPKDFENLNCLKKLNFRAYKNGAIDLNSLDLSKNTNLIEFTIQSWYNNITGIPKGIKASKVEKIKIEHLALTKFEKDALNELKVNR